MRAHLKYLSYVARHKAFVFYAGLKTGAPLWRLIIHDWSKFSPAEWNPYVQKFYGKPLSDLEGQQRRNKAFTKAWLHHIHRNPHHWNHWVMPGSSNYIEGSTKGVLPMPENFIREMVADWAGAGRAITGTWEIDQWYDDNRDKMILHPKTRTRVEQLLGRLT